MNNTTTKKIPGFDQRVCYRIKIQGKLDQSWVDRFYDMSVEVKHLGDSKYVSTLTGFLPDQAALSGLLNTLYDMHFTILSLDMVKSEEDK